GYSAASGARAFFDFTRWWKGVPMARRSIGIVLASLAVFSMGSGPESGKYVVEAPDVLEILAYALPGKGELVEGQHLVRPDGTVSLGRYGSVRVQGLTLDEATAKIVGQLTSNGVPG